MQRHAHKEQAQSERKWEIEGERERERDKCMHVYAIATVRVCVSGCESAIENCSATLYVCVCILIALPLHVCFHALGTGLRWIKLQRIRASETEGERERKEGRASM